MNKLEKNVVDVFELQEMNLEQLKAKAQELHAQIEGLDDVADIIAAIVEATESVDTGEAEVGVLFPLHSRTDSAKEFIYDARNRILKNESADGFRPKKLILRDVNGNLYDRTAPFVRVASEEGRKKVLEAVVELPDPKQKEMLQEFREHPEKFEEPLLVRVTREGEQGRQPKYVMLYLKKKQGRVREQTL